MVLFIFNGATADDSEDSGRLPSGPTAAAEPLLSKQPDLGEDDTRKWHDPAFKLKAQLRAAAIIRIKIV